MSDVVFIERGELGEYEWDNQRKEWKRPVIAGDVLRELAQRSTLNGLLRGAYFVALLVASAIATVFVARYSLLLALPVLYLYYLVYGFWVGIGHELQHRTMFAKSADWFSEIVFFFVQTLMWNSPRYVRISHKLHHRFTMVRGLDPETDWPAVISSGWLRKFLFSMILKIVVVGAVVELGRLVWVQVRRTIGRKDRMMREHCSDRDIAAIRMESLAILLIHSAIVAIAIVFGVWELLVFITIAWQIGSPIEGLWHATKHIGRPHNVNDHRLNTRSIRVSPFIRMIFWGLDDHVEHHLFPIVPSRNLPKLRELLHEQLADPHNIFGCWSEMFEILNEKDRTPSSEFVAIDLGS